MSFVDEIMKDIMKHTEKAEEKGIAPEGTVDALKEKHPEWFEEKVKIAE